MNILGIVRLSQGEVGYYDDLTRIHLTISNPERTILEGTNTHNLKKAVKSGRLQLVSGSLDPEAPVVPKPVSAIPISKPAGDKDTVGEKKIEKAPEVSTEAETVIPAVEQSTATSVESLIIEPEKVQPVATIAPVVETPVVPVVDAYADTTEAEEIKQDEVKKASSRRKQ